MQSRFQFSLATILLATSCVALAIGWWSSAQRKQPELKASLHVPSNTAIYELPITVAASEVGDFSKGRSWYLSVNSAGEADLTIDNDHKNRLQQFTLSRAQLGELRNLLIFHDFFARADDYGEIVPSGSTRTMTISIGSASKTVRLHFLGNGVKSDTNKLREAAGALSVWKLVRGWIEHPEAVDTRAFDQMAFEVLKKK